MCIRDRFDHENGGDYQIFAVLFSSLSEQENRDIFQMIERDPRSRSSGKNF